MKWVKYRRKTAYSAGEWEYEIFHDSYTEEDLQEYFNAKNFEWDWSERHRGFEWEVIEKPPAQILVDKIAETKRKLAYLTDTLSQLNEQYSKWYENASD